MIPMKNNNALGFFMKINDYKDFESTDACGKLKDIPKLINVSESRWFLWILLT